LASGRQYGNALLGVRHQEEECMDTCRHIMGKGDASLLSVSQMHNFHSE